MARLATVCNRGAGYIYSLKKLLSMEKIEHINYINAPIGKVYEALTTQAGLGGVWTTELTVHSGVGVINEFGFGSDDIVKMKVVELVENKRIEWLCTDSDPEWVATGVSFDLTERKNGVTAVVLKHFDWRELTEFYQWCNYNWAMFLLSLKHYVEDGKGTPYQERKF
jgi:uncharacterized protein YndB with AHSA1/START domain